jgi:hypothetical protein
MKTTPKEKNNLGGIAKAWVIPSHMVAINIPPTPENPFRLPLGFEFSSIQLDFICQSAQFTEKERRETAGTSYESTISFKLPKDSEEMQLCLSAFTDRPWAILTQDQNGLFRLTGSQAYPMRSSRSKTTGAEISDLNHISLEFSCWSLYPSIFIPDPLLPF